MASTVPLYTIPLEIWLSILVHLTEPDFLSLKQSSPRLRCLISDNAATICNTIIMKHYAEEAAILRSTFRDGWLVPTLPAILREESRIGHFTIRPKPYVRSAHSSRETFPSSPTRRLPLQLREYHEIINDFYDLAPQFVRTKLSKPGPQYLRYLIEYSFEIRIANSMFIDVPARGRAVSISATRDYNTETPEERLDRWIGVYTVKKFLDRLHKIAKGLESSPFSSFGSDSSSMSLADEKSLAFLKATADGLAWFYD